MGARLCIAISATFGALAVSGGAFAAHALKGKLSPQALDTFALGSRYQMYHALALLAVGLLLLQQPDNRWLSYGAIALTAGTVLFSGSLYGLSLGGLKWLGPVTPLGGVALIAGWVMVAIAAGSLGR